VLYIDHPLHFDRSGHTARTTRDDHVLDLILQFYLTNLSERVNRPDFGTPLARSVFGGNSPELADLTGVLARAGLQRWLGDAIEILDLVATADGAVLALDLKYQVRGEAGVRQGTRRVPRPDGGAT
jgi:phage baseplate assembly protein W